MHQYTFTVTTTDLLFQFLLFSVQKQLFSVCEIVARAAILVLRNS